MRALFVWVRTGGALAAAVAVIAQLVHAIEYWTETGVRDLSVSITNYFSYFTVQSNIAASVVLAVGAIRLARATPEYVDSRAFAVARVCVTSYILTTGIVYNVLLRPLDTAHPVTLRWADEIMHVVVPLILLADIVLAPGRRRVGWSAVGIVIVYPIAWAVYTLVRAPFTYSDAQHRNGWYPYPFLDPTTGTGSLVSVLTYIVAIAALIVLVSVAVLSLIRRHSAGRAG
ncbi:Pr6Pr family membrane protein [Homoserinibacter sp. GY 40078]|uniref:Pr6Pr family membrane protein n=1 Tax=Homoserinibacter sp. GY 40078 TaxID=2603275 RepID=UPI0011C9DAFC|nr:Pr6Pr family membrane protein [Homoserinibacter sp. GY 40078]TXK18513.1 hypothetical protein FVQ89_00695 [Homoserinibacter sp. GY 40078]